METDTRKISFNQGLVFDRCRFLWKLKYKDKWEKVDRGTKMELGTMGHHLLFDYYKTGQDHSADFANAWMADLDTLDGEQIQNIAVAVSQFKLYRELFAPDEDRGLTTTELEYHFEVELMTPGGHPFILEGYIDRMSVDRRGLLWVEDYKWTGRFWSNIELLMDPQLPLYAAALRHSGVPVHGLMITQVNTYPYKGENRSKQPLDKLFKRERLSVSTTQTDTVLYEYGMIVDEMIEYDGEMRRSLRRDCKSCEMQEPCSMGIKGIDPVQFMSMSPGFQMKRPRPVERMDGVPQPLQVRTRIPDVTVEGQDIILTY